MTNKIQQARIKAKISQAELAKACGLKSPSSIANYESGIRSPRIGLAHAIVEALNKFGANCTFDDVFPPSKDKAA